MTETLNRPSRPSSMPPRRSMPDAPSRGLLALGAGAGVWAAAVGLLGVTVLALLVWWSDSRSGVGLGEALRSGGRLWLLGHGVTLDVPGGRFALTPLGLMLLPLALVARFAASAAGDARLPAVRPAASLALAAAVPYSVLALVVALLCSGPEVHVSPVQALAGGFLVAAVGAAAGALRPDRLRRAAWHALAQRTRRLVGAGAAATVLLLGAAALLTGGSLAFHFARAAELAGASQPGAVGGVALLLAGLALVPNAVIWGACWLAGPGFAVGVGTAVGPFGYDVGPLPAVPILAALPTGGVPEWVAVLVLGVPVLAGAVAGRLVASALGPDQLTWRRTVLESAAVGPVCGAVLGLLAWLSGGAAGGDRLAEVGPSPWTVALAVTAAVGAGAVAGALVRRARLLS